jgi:hypothetical protein
MFWSGKQITLLGPDGRSNQEESVQSFVSQRSVEWHLRDVYAKFLISSPEKLRDTLPLIDGGTTG